jgi:polyisoprenyl-phosphate glycosyltransferase
MKTLTLSVVAPCFNEEGCLEEFFNRVTIVCEQCVNDAYEIVLVDDGSHDGTWSVMDALSRRSSKVVGVRMFRNHGHQLAATAGLSVCRGDRVLLIDADLQDPPEALPAMMKLMDDGADVVYGRRKRREGETWFKLTTAYWFYRILRVLSPIENS